MAELYPCSRNSRAAVSRTSARREILGILFYLPPAGSYRVMLSGTLDIHSVSRRQCVT